MGLHIRLITLLFLFHLSPVPLYGQSWPLVNHTELGLLWGRTDLDENRFNFVFQHFSGVKPHPRHEVGFLLGVDTYPGFNLMPVAMGWRGMIDQGKRTSFYPSLDIGYGSAWLEKRRLINQTENRYQGGLMISPAVGFRIKAPNGNHFYSWSLGFKSQRASFFEGIRSQDLVRIQDNPLLPHGFISVWEERYFLKSLMIKMGLVF